MLPPSPLSNYLDVYLVIRAIRCVATSRGERSGRQGPYRRNNTSILRRPTIDPCRGLKKWDVRAIARRGSLATRTRKCLSHSSLRFYDGRLGDERIFASSLTCLIHAKFSVPGPSWCEKIASGDFKPIAPTLVSPDPDSSSDALFFLHFIWTSLFKSVIERYERERERE